MTMLARVILLLVGGWYASLGWAATAPHYELSITLDPVAQSLRVSARLRLPAGQDDTLSLSGRFKLEHVSVDGRSVTPRREVAGAGLWRVPIHASTGRAIMVEIRYSGLLDAIDAALDHRQVLGLSSPVTGAEGAYLPGASLWYPQSRHSALTYRVRIDLPSGFRALVPGKLIEESVNSSGTSVEFESRVALPGIDLIAGPYVIHERTVRLAVEREVRIRTYFHRELEPLASGYLDSAAGYILRYDREIGPYAFASYSIVSSALPTGVGLAGIAYLGRQVLRLPFIRATSLGHEVLHDWWGNGVYPDYAQGNWSEGLTTFLADYAYKEGEGEAQARAMRLGWLRDYAAVHPAPDRPLSAFVSRRHGADQAVGYSKTAFVFFMLRDLMGEAQFRAGLRGIYANFRFRNASWDDLRREFEAVSGRDLRNFFAQWVSRPGAPQLEVVAARRALVQDRHRVTIELRQTEPTFQLSAPLRIDLEGGGSVATAVVMQGPRAQVEVDVPQRALSVVIDPEVRLFRRLDAQEIAPTLRQVMFDPRTTVAIAGDDPSLRKSALALASATLEHEPRLSSGTALDRNTPVLFVGLHVPVSALLGRLGVPAVPESLGRSGSAFAYAWQTEDGRRYAVVSARDATALAAVARSLPHLGAQSFAIFEGGRSIERGVWPGEGRRFAVSDE